ncbi:type II toxin-antitoxin system VapB family antitoxin [Mesorhizobium sp. CN5-321]|jgi:antitoxin VapB|uniref:type II toxin-antitoxin system VapB family antitoxin n=1 Tax=Mesorhizobium hunchu TaxID=3157708 RepID=UPI0032B75CB6
MVLHVKDVETDDLVRRLASERGIGITEAIKEAVQEALQSDRERQSRREADSLEERLKPLLDRLDRLPRTGLRADKAFFDELWGEAAD